MKPPRDKNAATALRQAAEARLKAKPAPRRRLDAMELQKLQQELEVHQIELEMQNEELLAKQAELEAGIERYTDLYDFAPVGYFNLAADGQIRLVNLAGANLLGVEGARLVGRHLQSFLAEPDRPAFEIFLRQTFAATDRQSCEARLLETAGRQPFVELEATRSPAGNECRLVMLDITGRKREELALRASEEQLRQLAESVTDVFWIASADLQQIHYVSPGYERIWGRTAASLHAHPHQWIEAVVPEDRDRVAGVFASLLAGEPSVSVEYRIARPDGSVRWILDRGFQVRDTAGELIRLTGAASDTTLRKLAEAELLDAKEYAQTLLAASPIAIITYKASGAAVSANESAARLIGTTLENLKQQNFRELDSWKKSKLFAMAELALATGQAQSFENHIISTFDVESWTSCQFMPFRFGGEPHLMLLARDITERKSAEQALRRSQERYQLAERATQDGLWDWNILTGEDYFSPRWKEIIGYRDDEIVNQRSAFLELLHPDDLAVVNEATRGLIEGGDRYAVEFRLRHKDGSYRWVFSRGEPVQDATGRPIRIVGSVQDITERKLAESALQLNEQRYRRLFELESDALVLLDSEAHRFVDVNQSAERLYGYSREEFLQMKAEDVSAEPEKTRTSVGTGRLFVPLRWHRKKDGSVFPVEITANVIEHLGRRTELAAIRDISERQQALQRLQETAAQLLDAQKIANLGSYVFEVTTGHWTCSVALDELFGLPEPGFTKDVTGWLDVIHPEERAELQRYLNERVLKNKAAFDRIYRIVRRNDQQVRWVHGIGKLVLDDHGRVLKMVGVIQDVTERKLAEDRLKLQISALTAAANAIVITDRHGKIEWVNPAFTKLTGYSAEEARGGNPRVLKSGEHPPAFYSTMWATVLTGNVWHGELVNKRKDGRLYTEEMTITPVQGEDGQLAHFIAVKQDITERRQMEKRMLQAQKMEAIGQLAGGIAHDFNNMLAAMFGYAHMLQQDTVGNALAQESVAEILIAANRAKELVRQILTFSRQREQQPQVIKLDTIVKEAIKFLRASMPAHIKIEKELAAETPAVLADPTQIYQVVMNLAINAFHAMEDVPGRLLVGLDSVLPAAPLLQAHPELKPILYARLTVADTGHGMGAKTLERIFEPFFTTKPVGQGTGLGLAVVHGIMETHHGVITVESQMGQGTTFTLYFPAQAQADTLTATAAGAVPHGHGQKILVLDDEPALTSLLQRMLGRLDYQVTTSNQASEAIRVVGENPAQFDVVITDLTMPEMNGLEVARQLHTLRPNLPIILVSGYSVSVNADRLREAGICERLDKPIAPSLLAEALARVLNQNPEPG